MKDLNKKYLFSFDGKHWNSCNPNKKYSNDISEIESYINNLHLPNIKYFIGEPIELDFSSIDEELFSKNFIEALNNSILGNIYEFELCNNFNIQTIKNFLKLLVVENTIIQTNHIKNIIEKTT